MKRDSIRTLIVVIAAVLAAGCRSHGKIRIEPITHLAIGQTVPLAAYEERRPFSLFKSAKAAAAERIDRQPVTAKWSVSDASIASVDPNGILTGKKPGSVIIKALMEDREATANVQVVTSLPAKQFLPQLSTHGTISTPNEIKLALGKEGVLRFHAGFDDPQDDVTLEQKALDQKMPWTFSYPKGTVELTTAAGMQVTGEVRTNQGGRVAFSVWSDDEGTYPISLQGKTLIIVGDSMAEGLAWFLRGKVEAAGGHFFNEPWDSSSTIGWQAARRMTELVERYKPDIVFIALGSNEITVPNVGARASAVKQISEEMGDRPGYWIGPPSWKPDKGIVHVIEENFRPGHFYNANDLNVPRRKDGAHPTRDGFKTWADLVWDWYARTG
jgi:lysophospholipase L1-like esterase